MRAKANATLRRRHEGQSPEMKDKPTPSPDPARREQLEILHQEVDRLPEKYRAAVVLCHLEGRTHSEAARLLKCPIGTVSIRVSRARELLRDRLTGRGMALPAALAGVTLLSQDARGSSDPQGTGRIHDQGRDSRRGWQSDGGRDGPGRGRSTN